MPLAWVPLAARRHCRCHRLQKPPFEPRFARMIPVNENKKCTFHFSHFVDALMEHSRANVNAQGCVLCLSCNHSCGSFSSYTWSAPRCVYVWICMYMYTYLYVIYFTYVFAYICVFARAPTCMFTRICMCMRICKVHTCKCVGMYTHAYDAYM